MEGLASWTSVRALRSACSRAWVGARGPRPRTPFPPLHRDGIAGRGFGAALTVIRALGDTEDNFELDPTAGHLPRSRLVCGRVRLGQSRLREVARGYAA